MIEMIENFEYLKELQIIVVSCCALLVYTIPPFVFYVKVQSCLRKETFSLHRIH